METRVWDAGCEDARFRRWVYSDEGLGDGDGEGDGDGVGDAGTGTCGREIGEAGKSNWGRGNATPGTGTPRMNAQ